MRVRVRAKFVVRIRPSASGKAGRVRLGERVGVRLRANASASKRPGQG